MTATTGETPCRMRSSSRWTKCRCPQCRPSQLRVEKQVRHGYLTRIPPETGWAAFVAMVDAGWPPTAIASACGLRVRQMQEAYARYRAGRPVRFGAVTCERLCDPGAPLAGVVPARVAIRQARALARIGWTTSMIAARAGVAATTVRDIQAGRRVMARGDVVAAIDGVYAALSGIVGPSHVAASRAHREGWPPPYAWVDITDLGETPAGFRFADARVGTAEATRAAERDAKRRR